MARTPRQDSRELGRHLYSLDFALQDGDYSAREWGSFLGCSRRTARRAMTYARRFAEADLPAADRGEEVRHGR